MLNYRCTTFFLLIALLLQFHQGTAQSIRYDNAPAAAPVSGDSLFTIYLSDTLNATHKIKQLINISWMWREQHKTTPALQCYQVAIALAPYVKDEPEVLFRLHADFAGLLQSIGAIELAMENWKEALRIYRTYKPGASFESCNIMGSMVGYYIQMAQYDSAFYYYDIALHESERTGNSSLIASANNNIGMLKVTTGDYAAAHHYYTKAINVLLIRTEADSSLLTSITDNLAGLAILENKWDEARMHYATNISLAAEMCRKNSENYGRLFLSLCGDINILLKTNRIAEAGRKMKSVDTILATQREWLKDKHMYTFYNLKYEYARLTNNPSEMTIYHHYITAFHDSINAASRDITDPLAKAMVNITINKFDKDLELYRMQLADKERALQSAKEKQLWNFLIAATTILCSVFTFLYFRNRNRLQKNEIRLQQYKHDLAEKELQNKKLEQEKTERELHHKKSDLRDLGVYLSRLKHLHFSMAQKLDTLKTQKPDQIKEAIANLVREWDTELYSQQHLQLIQENIDQVNSEFYSSLRTSYPDLTKSEVELCGLLKLNLSSKEIGVMKGISQESVKMARYRLRKKLGLKPEDDIYQSLSLV